MTFIGYKQTDTQTDKQTDKPNLYIDFEHNSRKTNQSIRNPKNSNFRIPISLHHDDENLKKIGVFEKFISLNAKIKQIFY